MLYLLDTNTLTLLMDRDMRIATRMGAFDPDDEATI
jgi:hypothetical protein